jgi:hypothetical protein
MAVIRDLALILLAAEAFVVALVPLALVGALVYGLGWLLRRDHLPAWIKVVQAYFALGRAYVELAMAAIVKPILAIHSILAHIRGWFGAIVKMGGGR